MINLHIGGKQEHPEWKILDIEPRPEVDFIGDASDLSQFPDNSISSIYASHVLEHFHYGLDNELLTVLQEWLRVLIPGGRLLISVPDLRTMCWLYSNPDASVMERHHFMRIMFGGHMNEYDVHRVGFDADTLSLYLSEAGFADMELTDEFGIFQDSSSLRILGQLISLNVIAIKAE
ncbi:MAG: methyltransferase domain-containing protein [Synechococcales cyanobacterium RM1_1_8]|nr:methyltransferase domain-containing protein [Synechococcales cyanobacterium RM1_1_8]